MPWPLATLVQLTRDKRGVTAVEYGLIVAFIAVVILTAVGTLGTKLSTEFIILAGRLSTINAAVK